MSETRQPLILLTGATGYIGGRFLKTLEQARHRVRCLARRPEFLRPKVGPETEAVSGDVLNPQSLVAALHGVHTAYSLIHSMTATPDFEAVDRQAAENFADSGLTAHPAWLGR